MLTRRSLLLWQDGDRNPDTGYVTLQRCLVHPNTHRSIYRLPFKRPVLVPDGLTIYTTQRKQLWPRIKTFFSRLKTSLRLKTSSDSTNSSERSSQQQSSFRRSLIASALLEREYTSFKPPNKPAQVLSGSTVPNQGVWKKDRCPLTEGHPILRKNPDVHSKSGPKICHGGMDPSIWIF